MFVLKNKKNYTLDITKSLNSDTKKIIPYSSILSHILLSKIAQYPLDIHLPVILSPIVTLNLIMPLSPAPFSTLH